MCKQGEIYTLEVPYTEGNYRESRPVIIVSKNSLIKGRKDILVAAISKTNRALKDENSVEIYNEQFFGGELKHSPSAIQSPHLVNTHKMWLEHYVGEVDDEKLAEVLSKIRNIFITE